MGFNIKTWTNPINLDANNLNRMEQGIKNSHDTLEIINEEVANLQNKQADITKNLGSLIKDTPNILNTLNSVSKLLENNDISAILTSADSFLMKTKQVLTNSELEQIYKNLNLNSFLKLTAIKVNNKDVVQGSEVNIILPTIDDALNINSDNAISNKAISKALQNLQVNVEVPETLADLKQDSEHQTVSLLEKKQWNSYKDTLENLKELDPTVPDWAKEPFKPNYEWIEILNRPIIPTNNIQLDNGAGYLTEVNTTSLINAAIEQFNTDTITPINNHLNALDSKDTSILNSIQSKADKTHKHTEEDITNLKDYSLSSHRHDTLYAEKGHNHDDLYSSKDHSHSEYSLNSHTHDYSSVYSNLNHNHDSTYASLSHNHEKEDITNFSHTHTESDISDFGAYLPLSAGSGKPLNGILYADSGIRIGSSNYLRFVNEAKFITPSKVVRFGSSTDNNSDLLVITQSYLRPNGNNTTLGNSSNQWKEIYGTTIYQSGKQVANAEDIPTDYLPKTGGTMEGDINLSTNRGLQGTTSTGGIFDVFRLINSTRLQVGGSYPSLEFKGKDAKPTYNGNDIALFSDITANALALDGSNTMTGKLNLKATGANEGNIGTNGIRWNLDSLPQDTAPQYVCTIEGFALGGRQKWSTVLDLKAQMQIHKLGTTNWNVTQDSSGNLVFTYA